MNQILNLFFPSKYPFFSFRTQLVALKYYRRCAYLLRRCMHTLCVISKTTGLYLRPSVCFQEIQSRPEQDKNDLSLKFYKTETSFYVAFRPMRFVLSPRVRVIPFRLKCRLRFSGFFPSLISFSMNMATAFALFL